MVYLQMTVSQWESDTLGPQPDFIEAIKFTQTVTLPAVFLQTGTVNKAAPITFTVLEGASDHSDEA